MRGLLQIVVPLFQELNGSDQELVLVVVVEYVRNIYTHIDTNLSNHGEAW